MASWFTARAAGFVVTHTEWNSALAAMADWLGNVNAGGFNLSNLGRLTMATGGYVSGNTAFGSITPVSPIHVVGSDASNSVSQDNAAICIENSDLSSFGRTTTLHFRQASGLAGADTKRIAAISGVYAEFDGTNGAGGDLAFSTKKAAIATLTERMRITADGWIKILNTGAPGTNPTGGGYLYVESGALKYRGSSGTVTVLGPA